MVTEGEEVQSGHLNLKQIAKSELVPYILGCIGSKFGFEPGEDESNV